jgi:hypothetical protein
MYLPEHTVFARHARAGDDRTKSRQISAFLIGPPPALLLSDCAQPQGR